MTSHRKVQDSQVVRVPFAWENQPGISKVTHKEPCPTDVGHYALMSLPPPPCPSDSPKVLVQDLQIPLPPCPFQPPSRSSSRKGLITRQQEDPFLAAYKECTKSVGQSKKVGGSRVRRNGSMFSCKESCGVREDSLVRVSHLSPSVSRERKSDSSKGGYGSR